MWSFEMATVFESSLWSTEREREREHWLC